MSSSHLIRSSSPPIGIHILLNVYDVPDTSLLCNRENGLPVLDDIVRELQLTVVSQTGHQFSPEGYTHAYVLSESHFTIHTYPEYHSCYIDIFCCNPTFQPERAIQYIRRMFRTENVASHVIRR